MALLVIVAAVCLYVIPWFVAAQRDVPNVGSVAIVNIAFGWTVIGWIVALAMAMRDPRTE